MKFVKIFFIALILSVASAFAFTYSVEPVNSTILASETAVYKVVVENDLEYADYFTISSRGLDWTVWSDPAGAQAQALGSVEFLVKIKPKSSVLEGNVYIVPIQITSEMTNKFIEDNRRFAVFIGPYAIPQYVPSIIPSVSIDKQIDPREKVSVRVTLRNLNKRDLPSLEVYIDGEVFSKTYTTDLLPMEEKTNELLFNLDPLLEPGKKTLKLTIVFENKTRGQSTTEYEIVGYEDIVFEPQKFPEIFLTRQVVKVTNDGNKQALAEYSFSMSLFQRAFTKFSPDVVKEKDTEGKTIYVVRQPIESQESFEIEVVTNYRTLVSIIALIIIAIVMYFVFRSPVILGKGAEPVGKGQDGLSEVKVRLFLKNRSGKPVTLVRVTDTIPGIAEIKKTSHVGSMDPVSVTKGRRGTIARWEFDTLEPYEERVMTYRIESKLKLVGGIKLPNAKVRFEARKGKERLAYSNSVNLIHGKTEE